MSEGSHRAYERLARVVRRSGERDLLPLDEATRRLRPFARHYAGLKAIPVAQVIGTDGRGADFSRDFKARRPDVARRRLSVERAFPEGDYPPIVAYQLGDAYFVIDGHHRVASARKHGVELIDAEVTELRARWHLPADADVVELIHGELEGIFMEESGLAESRPELRIRFGKPTGYIELLENVQIHGFHLMQAAGRVLERAEIAADWHDTIYRPAVEAIREEGLADAFPDATEADLFLTVYERRRELFPDCGCPPLQETARHMPPPPPERHGLRRLAGRR